MPSINQHDWISVIKRDGRDHEDYDNLEEEGSPSTTQAPEVSDSVNLQGKEDENRKEDEQEEEEEEEEGESERPKGEEEKGESEEVKPNGKSEGENGQLNGSSNGKIEHHGNPRVHVGHTGSNHTKNHRLHKPNQVKPQLVSIESNLTALHPSGPGIAGSTWAEVKHGVNMIHETTKLPVHAVFMVIVVVLVVIVAALYCCIRSWWRKFKDSDRVKNFKGLDLKSVNLMGSMGKEKVQPDSADLKGNMEQNESEQQKDGEEKEPVNLGKLQYKLDYDFNSNNVS